MGLVPMGGKLRSMFGYGYGDAFASKTRPLVSHLQLPRVVTLKGKNCPMTNMVPVEVVGAIVGSHLALLEEKVCTSLLMLPHNNGFVNVCD